MNDKEEDRFPGKHINELPDELFEKVGEDSKQDNEEISRPSKSYWQDAWGRFRKDRLAMIGLCFVLIMAVFAIFGPMFSQYTYDGQDLNNGNQPPSSEHWFGTDKFGRDIFVRTLYGARISLLIGFVAAAINMVIGVIYGGLSGYFGGRVDMILMRIVDIMIGVPDLLYIILVMMFLGNSIQSILIALCLTSWIGTARIVRSQVVTLKHQEYALAARSIGSSNLRILFKHLIPNSIGPIIVTVTFLVPSAIFSEAFLSFLGIGIQVPIASWGTLVNDAIPTIFTQPYQMLFPALAISLTMFSLNFIGDGLRDALDPRLKK
ncbi:ABC transporter permease [Brevibacillus invocatus]|uniref:ABC transporter permease n=2 Tax=Brevibacillus TaxID=55080 RepID=A0A3M8CMW1_9BACL|nr:ABC transporter permease [Brevibacillus invocatus]MCM3078338.1 ABC transporter permease [Brevibacillus invocatus]MCM3428507.1 ABC transporter permease [Brevibacillus invocatus]MDH4616875.1 ABC transporter permease [Brevibacillus sp. AY1]RNB76215.1 ABC transporter permease [Brevibacillus invocatus]